jgi:hypothetical protein
LQQGSTSSAPAARIQCAKARNGQLPDRLPGFQQRFVFAQQERQGIGVRLARRAEPIVGSPGQGLHQLGVEQWRIVQYTNDTLETRAANVGRNVCFNHYADHLAAPERNQHTTANDHLTVSVR